MNEELEVNFEGSNCGLIKALCWNLHGGIKENHRKPQSG
jgi:hypothetical protein